MLIESVQGMRRLQFGLKGKIGGIRTKGVEPVIGEEGDWKGARTSLRTDDPSRKMMCQIFGAIAEYDRAMIVLKLRGARHHVKLKVGRCEGRKPYGSWQGEDAIIVRMRTMR